MKKIARSFVISLLAFVAVAYFYPGFTYHSDVKVLLFASLIFAVLTLFIRPLIKLLMLPFNLLTFGVFSFIINVVILYSVGFIIHDFHIVAFHFSGANYSGFVLPAASLNVFFSALVASFIIGWLTTILQWIFR